MKRKIFTALLSALLLILPAVQAFCEETEIPENFSSFQQDFPVFMAQNIADLKAMSVGDTIALNNDVMHVEKMKLSDHFLNMDIEHQNDALPTHFARAYLVDLGNGFLSAEVHTTWDGLQAYDVCHFDDGAANVVPLYFSTTDDTAGTTELDMGKFYGGSDYTLTIEAVENEDGTVEKTQTIVDASGNAEQIIHTVITPKESGRTISAISTDAEGNVLLILDIDYTENADGTAKETHTFTDCFYNKTVVIEVTLKDGRAVDSTTSCTVSDIAQ